MSNPHFNEVLSADLWVTELGGGYIGLCDPFSGYPLSEDPATPPERFLHDRDLSDGYDLLRINGDQLSIGVLLSDVSRAEDLGPAGEFEAMVEEAELVGYALTRSVERAKKRQNAAPVIGAVSLGGELIPGEPFAERFYSATTRANKVPFNYDPPIDVLGHPVGKTTALLRKAREVVELQAWDETDQGGGALFADIAYSNVLGWQMVGQIGNRVGEELARTGRMPQEIMVVVPAEHADLARKLRAAGVEQTGSLVGHDEAAHITNQLYASVMERAVISPELLY